MPEKSPNMSMTILTVIKVFEIIGTCFELLLNSAFLSCLQHLGKYSHAKNFMMDIALVAQKRNMLACLDPGNYGKAKPVVGKITVARWRMSYNKITWTNI